MKNANVRQIALSTAGALLAAATLGACGSAGSQSAASGASVQVSAWGGRVNPGGQPVRGGTLTVDQTDSPSSFTPGQSAFWLASALQVGAQLYDTLVDYLPGSLDPRPGLAQSWSVSPDALTYTFHLRRERFSNGTPVTAADVKYTLDQVRRPTSPYSQLYDMISKIHVVNSAEAVVRLSRPTPAFIYSLAFIDAGIVSSKLVKSEGSTAYSHHPIGSGPFQIQRWLPGQEVDLAPNKFYWRSGEPYLSAVRFVATPNDNTRVLDLESGTADVATSVPYSQVKSLKAHSGLAVLVSPSTAIDVIGINQRSKPYSELAVRQALAYATPVKAIDQIAFAGLAPIMNTDTPRLKYWDSSVQPYSYNIAKAKQLLAQSSVPHGFNTTLSLPGTDQASNQTAAILQQSWAKIGVKVTIQRLDAATLLSDSIAGKLQLHLTLPTELDSDIPVPDELATLEFNSPQTHYLSSSYHNPAAARLAAAATSESGTTRARDFAKLQSITMQDPESIPLVYAPNAVAVRTSVHNFNYLLVGWPRLDTVWIGK